MFLSSKKWVDFFCFFSVIGIWPRFIEPNLISISDLSLPLPTWPKELDGLTIVQISDLHFPSSLSPSFLEKITQKVLSLSPDLIVFTGDFICRSELVEEEELLRWLQKFKAPLGCYAVLGNHDYSSYVTIDQKGWYTAAKKEKISFLSLFQKKSPIGKWNASLSNLKPHEDLLRLLEKTNWKLLINEHVILSHQNKKFAIVGLGEYSAYLCSPEKAFQAKPDIPTLVLSHNPDSIPHLQDYPFELFLSGHTHGCQVNFPGFRKKILSMEHPHFDRGLFQKKNKYYYINRGLGSSFSFRLFSLPEITRFRIRTREKS